MTLTAMFSNPKPIIGMIHICALPGTPASTQGVAEIVAQAAREAAVYRECGVDGIVIENMHDVPYLSGAVGPEIVAAMTLAGHAVKSESRLAVGIQILAGANLEAMAVAHAAGLDFIRAESFVFAHVADEGFIESSAAKLLRYRKLIGAERVQVWTDIKKKHSSHAITSDVSLGLMAETVEFMRGDAVIITGGVTGDPPKLADVEEAKTHCGLPVILGSGVDDQNIAQFFSKADGFIIGSYFKREGKWQNEVDARRVERLMDAARRSRDAVRGAWGDLIFPPNAF
jgi:membrane complex biogenesis BtpA family protein